MVQQLRKDTLEAEKFALMRQVDQLRAEVARLTSEKESLSDVSMSWLPDWCSSSSSCSISTVVLH